MARNIAKHLAAKLLAEAGVAINGNKPWDFMVKNDNVFDRVLARGSLGLGEAYMDGWWDAEKLDEFFYKVISAGLENKIGKNLKTVFRIAAAGIFNLQSRKRAFRVGKEHYDLGNDIYQNMLGRRLVYTCGYWKNAKNLDEAQDAKLDLVCKKLKLRPGMKILDIGCGWGSFAKFAAENYGVSVVGITVSKEQAELGRKLCGGLPVEIRLQDYRDLNGQFDRIVSLGMFEHVGRKNFGDYFKIANECLEDGGLLLLHTIGGNISTASVDPWMGKYIFPNGMIPSAKQIGRAIEGLFIMEDWHNFGSDYDKTLMAWFENFYSNWGKLKDKYGERFFRMWKYYLLSCAGAFRARDLQLWQIVLSKKGLPGGYESIR